MRRVDPDGEDADLALELSSGQTEARLSRQVLNDKQRAQVKRTREIVRAKGMMNRTKDKNLKNELKAKVNRLEAENKQERRFE